MLQRWDASEPNGAREPGEESDMTAKKRTRRTAPKRSSKAAQKTAKRGARKPPRSTRRKALAQAASRIRAVGKRAADVGEAAVRKATGKSLRHWFALLDRAGAKAMDHRSIVAILGKARGVSGWWQQMITVAYERARGLRQRYQTASGFTANVSKTVNAPLAALYDAWVDEAKERTWLGVPLPAVRSALPQRSLRLTWHDGSWVTVGFTDKGSGKAQVALAHERLPNARAVSKYKAFWKDALERLQTVVEQRHEAPITEPATVQ
jgi:uncharacterized protein YndB with AHSA1/START domain